MLEIVSNITSSSGFPLYHLKAEEAEKVIHLAKDLEKRITNKPIPRIANARDLLDLIDLLKRAINNPFHLAVTLRKIGVDEKFISLVNDMSLISANEVCYPAYSSISIPLGSWERVHLSQVCKNDADYAWISKSLKNKAMEVALRLFYILNGEE